MDNIVVDKADLISTLQTNLAQHRATYEKAMEGYKEAATQWLSTTLDGMLLGTVQPKELYFNSPVPEDHSEEYERLILMLDWDQSDTVELTRSEFTQYVQDDWGWKKSWTVTNSTYGV